MPRRLSPPAVAVIGLLAILYPEQALAIPPPDVIIQVASQLSGFFAVGLLLVSAVFSMGYQFVKASIRTHKRTFWLVSIAAIVCVSLLGAYVADRHYQQSEQKRFAELWQEGGLARSSAPERYDTPATGAQTNTFFVQNRDLAKSITEEELEGILRTASSDEYVLLDTREMSEFELGHIPGSIHMRYADIMAGGWSELPQEKYIYVLCYSGMRGQVITDHLRRQGMVARYLEDGVASWADGERLWQGEVDFFSAFADAKYRSVLAAQKVDTLVQDGAILVDSRPPERIAAVPIGAEVVLSTIETPSSKLDAEYAKIPPESPVITVCDELVSCFDATITGIELEKRGATFLGKYYVVASSPAPM